eukprot:5892638-Pyramimonas_sp.AAC.1
MLRAVNSVQAVPGWRRDHDFSCEASQGGVLSPIIPGRQLNTRFPDRPFSSASRDLLGENEICRLERMVGARRLDAWLTPDVRCDDNDRPVTTLCLTPVFRRGFL